MTVPLILCIDVGSPKNIGWADSTGRSGSGADLAVALAVAAAALRGGGQVALGFEAPIWTPRRDELSRITGSRGGIERRYNRAWAAGAGTGALGAALALMPWSFARIRDDAGPVETTVDLGRFRAGSARVLLWEAFVSGVLKGTSHHDDARLAVEAFAARWPDIGTDVPAEPALNHAVSAALASGLAIPPKELGTAALVVGVTERTLADPALA